MDRSTGEILGLDDFFRESETLNPIEAVRQTAILREMCVTPEDVTQMEESVALMDEQMLVTPEDVAQMDAGIDVVSHRFKGLEDADGNIAMKSWHADTGKPAFELIPPQGMLELARVAEYGRMKYGAQNYAEEADNWSWLEPIGSIFRHTWAFLRGEMFDAESGLYHLAHAAFNALMLIDIIHHGKGKDNRSPLVKPHQEEAWSPIFGEDDEVGR